MTANVLMPEDNPEVGRVDTRRVGERPSKAVWDLLLFQTAALTLQLIAVSLAWRDVTVQANVLSCAGIAVTFTSAVWALARPQLPPALRNTAVVCLGLTTAVQWRMSDPLLFRGYDEQLHMRTLVDISSSHSLFQPHPLLHVSPRYPGLEALAAFFNQLGLPTMFAATAVVLIARFTLVLTLCAAVEYLTGSPRAGGLAVAVYAISPQFVFFNSQFAYQTLSLPLGLAAVAFVARGRHSQNAKPLLAGAFICLLAVALTHHLTSLLTAAFLVIWAVVEPKGRPRQRVCWGALFAILATTFWAAIQWSLLRDYFGPMIDDVRLQLSHGIQRSPFSETSTDPKPWWEQGLLIYYAIVVTLVVSWLVLLRGRFIVLRGHGARHLRRWRPRFLLVLLVAMIPVFFGARVMPRWGEVGDRASTFLYLPLSLLVVAGALHWLRHRPDARPPGGVLLRSLVLTLGTMAFLGGYLLGAGSEWARLPGGYLPGGEGRSMDAETLAAVRWAGAELPTGSRIGADRLSATLLASQARLWPVLTHNDSPEVAALYQADDWGPVESDIVRSKHLRYLYVDRRFAGAAPRVGTYFDESPPLKLNTAQLEKFDHVSGIQEVYRHGPISVYDLGGLGVSDIRSGWYGNAPTLAISTQVVVGVLSGLAITLTIRTDPSRRVVARVTRSIYTAAGPALAFAGGLAALIVGTVIMILMRVWLGPAVFLSAAVVALLANWPWAIRTARNVLARTRWVWVIAIGSLALAASAAIALSAVHAASARHLAPATGVVARATSTSSAPNSSGPYSLRDCAKRCSTPMKGSVR